jgi:hypothetical protein
VTRKTAAKAKDATPERPQPDKDFEKNFEISWSVRRIIEHLPKGVDDAKTGSGSSNGRCSGSGEIIGHTGMITSCTTGTRGTPGTPTMKS